MPEADVLTARREHRHATNEPSGSLAALNMSVRERAVEPRVADPRPDDGTARVGFNWLSGHHLLVKRRSLPVPEVPDGIAIIGTDPSPEGAYLQRGFGARGVARVYRMTLDGNIWTLRRAQADSSPRDFRQRSTAAIVDDGRAITGLWEICHDGASAERDVNLSYLRLSWAATTGATMSGPDEPLRTDSAPSPSRAAPEAESGRVRAHHPRPR